MKPGQTIIIDGRDYRLVGPIDRTEDGRRWTAVDEDGWAVTLVGPPWRLWTAPVRSAGARKTPAGE